MEGNQPINISHSDVFFSCFLSLSKIKHSRVRIKKIVHLFLPIEKLTSMYKIVFLMPLLLKVWLNFKKLI